MADFAELLRSEWLSSDILDLALDTLDHRLQQRTKLASHIVIGNLGLLYEIQRAVNAFDFSEKHVPHLFRLGRQIRSGALREIFLPANRHGMHWVMIHVDLDTGVVEYGAYRSYICKSVTDSEVDLE